MSKALEKVSEPLQEQIKLYLDGDEELQNITASAVKTYTRGHCGLFLCDLIVRIWNLFLILVRVVTCGCTPGSKWQRACRKLEESGRLKNGRNPSDLLRICISLNRKENSGNSDRLKVRFAEYFAPPAVARGSLAESAKALAMANMSGEEIQSLTNMANSAVGKYKTANDFLTSALEIADALKANVVNRPETAQAKAAFQALSEHPLAAMVTASLTNAWTAATAKPGEGDVTFVQRGEQAITAHADRQELLTYLVGTKNECFLTPQEFVRLTRISQEINKLIIALSPQNDKKELGEEELSKLSVQLTKKVDELIALFDNRYPDQSEESVKLLALGQQLLLVKSQETIGPSTTEAETDAEKTEEPKPKTLPLNQQLAKAADELISLVNQNTTTLSPTEMAKLALLNKQLNGVEAWIDVIARVDQKDRMDSLQLLQLIQEDHPFVLPIVLTFSPNMQLEFVKEMVRLTDGKAFASTLESLARTGKNFLWGLFSPEVQAAATIAPGILPKVDTLLNSFLSATTAAATTVAMPVITVSATDAAGSSSPPPPEPKGAGWTGMFTPGAVKDIGAVAAQANALMPQITATSGALRAAIAALAPRAAAATPPAAEPTKKAEVLEALFGKLKEKTQLEQESALQEIILAQTIAQIKQHSQGQITIHTTKAGEPAMNERIVQAAKHLIDAPVGEDRNPGVSQRLAGTLMDSV